MRTTARACLIALLVGTVLTVPVTAANADSRSNKLQVVGLVGGTTLVAFTSDNTRLRDSRAVTGLVGDARLAGIDYRVQDGKLYGVGNAGGVYTIDGKARATKVLQLTIPLDGASFAVDFNPAANALRILSNTGQNLRQPFATAGAATVADTPVAYTAGTPAQGVTGAGYTNNDLDASTATTLFDLDTTLNQVAVQSPANAGTLVATGQLGVDADLDAGFDVYSTLKNGRAVSVQGFATIGVGGTYSFYRVSLLSGQAERVGGFSKAVSDIAIPLDQR